VGGGLGQGRKEKVPPLSKTFLSSGDDLKRRSLLEKAFKKESGKWGGQESL